MSNARLEPAKCTVARAAYQSLDLEASRLAHDAKRASAGHNEEHSTAGGKLRTFIFGGLDGILTCFALISSCAGADLDARVVLLMGICNIFADALSMGVGEYLSTKSSNEFALFERKREAWELENNFDGEVAEMVDIYVKRGMTKDDATVIVERMAKYPSLFVDIMMVEELGLEVPTAGADGEALREGLLMFAAFVALGLVPLLGYVALPAMCGAAFPHHCAAARVDPDARFAAACVVTSAALFGLGAAKARFVGRKWYALGAESLLLGAACAAVAYGTSSWLNGFLPKGLAG